MCAATLYSFDQPDALAAALRSYIVDILDEAIRNGRRFRVAVSGGSLPATLAKALITPGGHDFKYDHWDVFFADERIVPLDHEDSNYALFKNEFLDKLPPSEPKPTVYAVSPGKIQAFEETQRNARTATKKVDACDVADSYQTELTKVFATKDSVPLPAFDLLLLGCGPDGHTCSLFPDHEILQENLAWVAGVTDSPKPPPNRTTLTLPVVKNAMNIAFVATGSGKKEVMMRIFDEQNTQLPCTMVTQHGYGKAFGEGKVSWFTDAAATEGVVYPKKTSYEKA